MNLSDFETCSECGRRIPRSEQACVFECSIVCAECDNILRNDLNTEKEIQKPMEQEILNLPEFESDQDYSEEERPVIRLPSFLRSCYLESNISSVHSHLISGYGGKRGIVMLLCLGGVAAITVVLLKIFLF